MIPVALLIKACGALVLVGGFTYAGHRYVEGEREEARQEVHAQWNAQKAKDVLAVQAKEAEWRTRYDKAINQGAEREKTLRAAARAASAAADSLRDTSATISQQIATANAETARTYATAYQAVFTDCARRYQAMGEAAQGHASDIATLEAAWPK